MFVICVLNADYCPVVVCLSCCVICVLPVCVFNLLLMLSFWVDLCPFVCDMCDHGLLFMFFCVDC